MMAELKKVAVQLEADWIQRASGKGFDAKAALAELRTHAKALQK
jgi:hypothetical protein